MSHSFQKTCSSEFNFTIVFILLVYSLLQMAGIGLTENVKGDKRKFELWLHGHGQVYTIQVGP